jgi:hypothetical protein
MVLFTKIASRFFLVLGTWYFVQKSLFASRLSLLASRFSPQAFPVFGGKLNWIFTFPLPKNNIWRLFFPRADTLGYEDFTPTGLYQT